MSQTPEELEKLMWSVAESGDTNAVEEFGERFPHLRGELGKRMDMVRQLRGAAKAGMPTRAIPRFENRAVRRAPIHTGTWLGGGIILLAVAASAFVVTRTLSRPAPTPDPLPVVQTTTPELPKPEIKYKAPESAPTPTPPTTDSVVENEPTDPAQKPQTVKLDHVRLTTAIKAVAASGGLQLELAPNLQDVYIQINYQGYSALAILQDMGRRYGFTAFDDGPHRVLVIPARDPNAPGETTATPLPDGADPRVTTKGGELPSPDPIDPRGRTPIDGSPVTGPIGHPNGGSAGQPRASQPPTSGPGKPVTPKEPKTNSVNPPKPVSKTDPSSNL